MTPGTMERLRGVERGVRAVERATQEPSNRAASTYTPGLWRAWYSVDEVSGAHTKALSVPAGFAVPEKSHFCDSDHEIFLFEGEFDFDEYTPLRPGDYLYRPAGTVYGNGEHSEAGGIQIISFGREKVSFHLDDPPKPWPGQYLVDRVWSSRPVEPLHIRSDDLPWLASSLGHGMAERRLRGVPGVASGTMGASAHSPWAADAAFVLRIPAGYAGPWPGWAGTRLELIVLDGAASSRDMMWGRGDYTIGVDHGRLTVESMLTCYCRSFSG